MSRQSIEREVAPKSIYERYERDGGKERRPNAGSESQIILWRKNLRGEKKKRKKKFREKWRRGKLRYAWFRFNNDDKQGEFEHARVQFVAYYQKEEHGSWSRERREDFSLRGIPNVPNSRCSAPRARINTFGIAGNYWNPRASRRVLVFLVVLVRPLDLLVVFSSSPGPLNFREKRVARI